MLNVVPFYLGIDGGQSSTTALIGDETGRVLGVGRGGPCNHVQSGDGREKFLRALRGCIDAAWAQAALSPDRMQFDAACGGFSGGPADKQDLFREVIAAERHEVTNDALIGLVGATGGAPGVITIAGTGSIALGRNASLRTARAGGWGYVFGDEGGAFDLVRQALRAALRREEGWGPDTSLHGRLLAATGAPDANDLMHRFYAADWPRSRVATLAPLVDEAAREGDAVAREILAGAAQQLATFAQCVRRQLFAEHDAVRVAHLGGVFRSELLRQHFTLLLTMDTAVEVGWPRYGPAAGALLEAYRLAGLTVTLSDVPDEKAA